MISATGWTLVTMPTDCPAITDPVSISPSITARRKRTGPETFDQQLGFFLRDLAGKKPVPCLCLMLQELLRPIVRQPAHRDHRETGVQLDRRQRVAG